MSNLVRCKACGYVMAEEKLGEVCPACGALRKVFEPYVDPVAPERRRRLDLDLHPILVHFPVAFSTSLVVLAVLPLILAGQARELFIATTKIVALFTPILGGVAGLAGLFDGRTRFRKLTRSPYLRRKILYGILFHVFAAALAVLVWVGWPDNRVLAAVVIAVALIAFVFSFLLGRLGKHLLTAIFPGK